MFLKPGNRTIGLLSWQENKKTPVDRNCPVLFSQRPAAKDAIIEKGRKALEEADLIIYAIFFTPEDRSKHEC